MSEKIDTQGLSGSGNEGNPLAVPNYYPQGYPPFIPEVRTIFTPLEREELKGIIKECLTEYFEQFGGGS